MDSYLDDAWESGFESGKEVMLELLELIIKMESKINNT